MRLSPLVAVAAVATLIIRPEVGVAQAARADAFASCVASLSPRVATGQRLRVSMRGAKAERSVLDGRFASASADGLTLSVGANERSIPVADIDRIQRRRSPARLWLAGVALGAVGTALSEVGSTNPEVADGFVVGGLVIGLPLGYIASRIFSGGATLCARQ